MRETIYRALLILAILLMSACNMPRADANSTATLDVTQAYQTVEARLTQVAAQSPAPTVTIEPTSTESAVSTPTGLATPLISPTTPPASSTSAVKLCDQAEAGSPIDVTIPDDTQMQPGQTFTKVWRLRNSGTCTWTKDYSIAVFSGEPMGAPDRVPLPNKVEPGQSVDITVDLVAPAAPGTYQGNWKLKNAAGVWFGIGPGGNSPFWVRVKVVGQGTITPSLSPTSGTPTTATVTPETPYPPATTVSDPPTLVSGNNMLVLTNRLNLDTNLINAGGEDLIFEANARGRLFLTPINGTAWAGFGMSAPSYATCSTAGLGTNSASVTDLPRGFYICYRTNQGHYGWLRFVGYNNSTGTLSVQLNTWSQP